MPKAAHNERKTNKQVLIVLLFLLFSVFVKAASSYWYGYGSNALWSNGSNWIGGVPGPGENAEWNRNGTMPCHLNHNAGTIDTLILSEYHEGVLIVEDGGMLTTTGDVRIMNRTGYLDIYSGGQLNVGGNLIIGQWDDLDNDEMILTMQGGTIHVDGELRLADYFNGVDGQYTVVSHVQLDGGQLFANSVSGLEANRGTLDITEGQLILSGDQKNNILGWTGTGYMTAYAGKGKIVYDYGETYAGKTTISAIPPVEGDVDGDFDVDIHDLVTFGGQWLIMNECGQTADFDSNCRVDLLDMSALSSNWLYGVNFYPYDAQPYSGQSLFPTALRWDSGDIIDSYDVYLGSDYLSVLAANQSSPEFQGNQIEKVFQLDTLMPEQTYYWRIDTVVGQTHYNGPVWNFSTVNSAGWKVVDTQPGEWISYEEVYLAAGNYRFTARLASDSANQKVHLELDGNSLGTVTVPNNGGDFQRIHLGHIYIHEGIYQLKFVFETGNVDLDWFFVKKSNNTADFYVVDDSVLVRADESGHPILGTITAYASSNGYHTEEGYEQPMYNLSDYDRDTPEFWDILVDELLLSRVNIVLMHGRGCYDPVVGDSGNGNICPRLLRHLVDAIDRNEGARETLKLGMWDDTGAYIGAYRHIEGLGDDVMFDLGLDADNDGVGDVWKYVWDYNVRIWFDTVPSDLWYRLDGKPVIAFWGPAWMTNLQGNASRMFAWLRTQFINRYGENPFFNVTYDWTTRDKTLTSDHVQGAEAWFFPEWYPGTDSWYSYRYWNHQWWGCSVPGFRNPNTTPGCSDSCREVPRLSGDSLRTALMEGITRGAKMTLLEGWTDDSESAGYYRSNFWDYPNQYIGIVRDFSDFETESLRLEAEGCDFYHDLSSGNSCGQYRSGDLDIQKISIDTP